MESAIWIKRILLALGHPQDITPLKIDNSIAKAFSNSTLKEKKIKAWDMRLYQIKYKVNEKEFYVYWKEGAENFADYFTKHFSPRYHQTIRLTSILKNNNMNMPELQRKGVLI